MELTERKLFASGTEKLEETSPFLAEEEAMFRQTGMRVGSAPSASSTAPAVDAKEGFAAEDLEHEVGSDLWGEAEGVE